MEVLPGVTCAIRQGILITSFFSLLACGGGSGSSSPPDTSDSDRLQTSANTNDLASTAMDAIYNNKRTPNGFYSEPAPDPSVFQTVLHIKNTDIMTAGSYDNSTPRYELCSNDFSEALNWSNLAGAALGSLVSNSDNTLYFQFTRSPIGSPNISNVQRVLKCGMIDRSMLDIRNTGNNWGNYIQTPQNIVQLKQLIEYLWTFSPANSYGHAVLSSNISSLDNKFLLEMSEARLLTAAAIGSNCDRIDVYKVAYNTDKVSGAVEISETLDNSFFSYFDGFSFSQCTPE